MAQGNTYVCWLEEITAKDVARVGGKNASLGTALTDLQQGKKSLERVGKALRQLFRKARFSDEITAAIRRAYRDLSLRYGSETHGYRMGQGWRDRRALYGTGACGDGPFPP